MHVVWSTARRQPILAVDGDERLRAFIGAKAREVGCSVLGVGCAPDHIHLLLRLGATESLARAVRHIKGTSARNAKREEIGRAYWQSGYWAESVSPADISPLLRYLREQRVRHDPSHPAENWMRD